MENLRRIFREMMAVRWLASLKSCFAKALLRVLSPTYTISFPYTHGACVFCPARYRPCYFTIKIVTIERRTCISWNFRGKGARQIFFIYERDYVLLLRIIPT